jgi:hypothetical protein
MHVLPNGRLMTAPKCSDQEFIRLFTAFGATETAARLKALERTVYRRRSNLEAKYGQPINAPTTRAKRADNPARIKISVPNGVVLVGGDGHYWPGNASTAHRAFVKFAKELKPKALIMNGDAFDGAAVSRHPSIGWEDQPSVAEELEAVQVRLGELEQATPRGCQLVWTLGNHDLRYESRLAAVAPEYKHLKGFHLKDFFPSWKPAWSCWINDKVVVKHRYRGGTHASHNNTVAAGMSIVTNHLHSAKVTPYDDYTGRRYGVDTGTLADPNGRQFVHYSEDNPKNHRSGFAVLSFVDGELLQPELALVWDENRIEFRGNLIRC